MSTVNNTLNHINAPAESRCSAFWEPLVFLGAREEKAAFRELNLQRKKTNTPNRTKTSARCPRTNAGQTDRGQGVFLVANSEHNRTRDRPAAADQTRAAVLHLSKNETRARRLARRRPFRLFTPKNVMAAASWPAARRGDAASAVGDSIPRSGPTPTQDKTPSILLRNSHRHRRHYSQL